MKITLIGKNDTYRTMLSWKEVMPDNVYYFMTHPRIGFKDKSTFNKELPEKLSMSDAIFIHISLRDRGFCQPLQFLNLDFEKHKDKSIIYFCGNTDCERIKEWNKVYRGWDRKISNNSKVSTLLNIPYVPTPLDFSSINEKRKFNKNMITIMCIIKLAGQEDRTPMEVEDLQNLVGYLYKKYKKCRYELKGSTEFKVIYNDFFDRCDILFDTYNGIWNLEGMTTCWKGIPTLSNLPYEYIKPHIDFTGTWTLPFINISSLNEFKKEMDNFLSNPSFISDEGKRARRWMKKYWHKDRHINNLNKILREFGL